MLFGREVERHPGADRAVDAAAAAGDECRDQRRRQNVGHEDLPDADLVGLVYQVRSAALSAPPAASASAMRRFLSWVRTQ